MSRSARVLMEGWVRIPGDAFCCRDSRVSNGALQFGMTKQELDSPQVLGSLTDQRRLGPPHAVRPSLGAKSDRRVSCPERAGSPDCSRVACCRLPG